MGVSQNQGCLFGGPHNKDYSIWGSILGSPYFGKLPYVLICTSVTQMSDCFLPTPFHADKTCKESQICASCSLLTDIFRRETIIISIHTVGSKLKFHEGVALSIKLCAGNDGICWPFWLRFDLP